MKRESYAAFVTLCLTACRPSAEPTARSTGPESSGGATQSSAAPAPAQLEPDGRFLGFAAYPGARPLCAEHVAGAPPPGGGPPLHITWASFETPDAPDVVLAYYAKPGASDAGFADARISIHAASGAPADGGAPYPRCDTAPSAAARTVIVVSRAAGAK
ncbi:MAG: hypothetical protein KC657_03505 [Myxococcales bacterium]|nr:hypothetical protein [Myxococcales bacterium]